MGHGDRPFVPVLSIKLPEKILSFCPAFLIITEVRLDFNYKNILLENNQLDMFKQYGYAANESISIYHM